ncbi:MAG: hypothetical protein ACK5H2_02410, partial [Beutenbergiaceae bacterium]
MPSAQAVEANDVINGSVGIFSNPFRPDQSTTPNCVAYGTGDPTVGYGGPQATTMGAHNEIRSGRNFLRDVIPLLPVCLPATDRTGIGFTGVTGANTVGDYFELGRFYDYNRTVSQPLHWVTLTTTLE